MDMLCRCLAFSSTTEALWLSEYDWGFSINKRPFTNREHTDKTGLHPMVYYCKINNGISTIMDTIINGTTLYENTLEKLFNRCMYVTVIFYRNKEIGLSSRHYKLTGILSEGQFIPIGIRNQWLPYYRLVINSQLNWHRSCSSLPHQTQGVQCCLCVGKE